MEFGYETVLWGHRIHDLPAVLATIAGAGFRGVEFAQQPEYLGARNLGALKREARSHGLEVLGLAGGTLQERMKFCNGDLGVYLLFQDAVREGWNKATVLKALEEGYALALHPHAFKPVRGLLDASKVLKRYPAMQFCPDTAHLAIVGDDPEQAIGQYMHRLAAVHLKDWTSQFGRSCHGFARGFTGLGGGDGSTQLEKVLDFLHARDFKRWVVVEQDVTTTTHADSVVQSARWLADYIRKRKWRGNPFWPSKPGTAALFVQPSEPRTIRRSQPRLKREADFLRRIMQAGTGPAAQVYPSIVKAFAKLIPCGYASVWACSLSNGIASLLTVEPLDTPMDRGALDPEKALLGIALDRRTVTRFDLTEKYPGVKYGYPEVKFSFPRMRDDRKLTSLISIPLLHESNLNHVRMIVSIALRAQDQAEAKRISDDELLEYGTCASIIARTMLDNRCAQAGSKANTLAANARFLKPYAKELVGLIRRELECEAASIFLVNNTALRLEEFVSTPGVHWREGLPESQRYYSRDDSQTTARAWREKIAILIADRSTRRPPEKSSEQTSRPEQLNGAVVVPMIAASGEVVGVIRCRNKRGAIANIPGIFSEDDIAILEAIMQAAVPHIQGMQLEQRRRATVMRLNHELKQPVLEIKTALEHITEAMEWKGALQQDEPADREHVDDIKVIAENIFWLIDDMDFFKYTTQELCIRPRLVPLKEEIILPIIRNMRLQLAENRFPPERITCEGFMTAEPGSGQDRSKVPQLYVDPHRFRQVIRNLLGNSVRFAHPDPARFRIEIEGRSADDRYYIEVRDYGIGLRKGTEEVIFKEGIRDSKTIEGDGYGLWIVRQVVEAHGGRIWVGNHVDPTQFTISLPTTLVRYPGHLPAVRRAKLADV